MDILYQSEKNGIKVALGSQGETAKFEETSFSNYVMTPEEDSNCKRFDSTDIISIPNSNAFIDFNADCMADIFMTRQTIDGSSSYYEIYAAVQAKDGEGKVIQKFCLAAQNGQITANESGPIPLIEIADVNRDGMFDLAFMSVPSGDLTVLYNKFKAPGHKEENLCARTGMTKDLAETNFFVNYPFSDGNDAIVQAPDSKSFPKETPVLDGLQESMPGVPGRLRFADLNSDGYPDAVLTLQLSSEDGKQTQSMTGVWMNTESNSTETQLERELIRGATPAEYYAKISTEAGTTSELVTALDIDEDGRLDIVLQKKDSTSGIPQIVVLYNNIVNDNFFIKALLVNSELQKNDNIYGNYGIGSTYRFIVTDMKDNKLVMVGSQAYQ